MSRMFPTPFFAFHAHLFSTNVSIYVSRHDSSGGGLWVHTESSAHNIASPGITVGGTHAAMVGMDRVRSHYRFGMLLLRARARHDSGGGGL